VSLGVLLLLHSTSVCLRALRVRHLLPLFLLSLLLVLVHVIIVELLTLLLVTLALLELRRVLDIHRLALVVSVGTRCVFADFSSVFAPLHQPFMAAIMRSLAVL